MKTDIRKKIQELEEKRISLLVKEADSALEKLFKEHGATEVRLVKDPHESEDIEAVTAPGIRFMQDGRTFRFTRFALVNKIVQAKVQEVVSKGDEEIFLAESDWTPLYVLKKDDDIDVNSVHIDETVQWLADDNYAWEFNHHIADMWNDDDIDPFDKPFVERPCIETTDDPSAKETTAIEDEEQGDFFAKQAEIDKQISELKRSRNNLVLIEGVPAIIAKMKELGKTEVNLRAAAMETACFDEEDLWFDGEGYAVKRLKIDEEGRLIAVYTEVWTETWGDEFEISYDNSTCEKVINLEIASTVITKTIKSLLTNDAIYDIVDDSSDEDEEEDEED